MANDEVLKRMNSDILGSVNPFDALYKINPEIATFAYAHKSEILASQMLPYVGLFRTMQSQEKVALVHGLARKYAVGGLVKKAEINAAVQLDKQKRQQETVVYGLDSLERMIGSKINGEVQITSMQEGGETLRRIIEEESRIKRLQAQVSGATNMHRLTCEANLLIAREHMDGAKYLSDNELRAAVLEADAQKYAVESQERIQGMILQKDIAISGHQLQAELQKANLEFAAKVEAAEIERAKQKYSDRTDLITRYIEQQTILFGKTIDAQTKIAISRDRLEEKRLEYESQNYKARQDVVRSALHVVGKGVSSGKKDIDLSVNSPDGRVEIFYRSKD